MFSVFAIFTLCIINLVICKDITSLNKNFKLDVDSCKQHVQLVSGPIGERFVLMGKCVWRIDE